jgi:DNA-binding Lrp family transcriptional regulator
MTDQGESQMPETQESIVLDATDRRLVAILTRDGRATNSAIARQLGLAESTSLARIKRLKDLGVINRFTVEIDRRKLGRPVQAIVHVRLRRNARKSTRDFYDHLIRQPDVEKVFLVAGRDDFVVQIATATPASLSKLVQEGILNHASVSRTVTQLILGTSTRHWPLEG